MKDQKLLKEAAKAQWDLQITAKIYILTKLIKLNGPLIQGQLVYMKRK